MGSNISLNGCVSEGKYACAADELVCLMPLAVPESTPGVPTRKLSKAAPGKKRHCVEHGRWQGA
eukprot:10422745-Alexandrium_andersonii.AAC.1